MDERLAELIGIILGDGCIKNYKRHKALKISFNSKDDLDYLEYVKNLVQEIFDIKPIIKFRKTENTVDLFLFKKRIVQYLLNQGLMSSPKWNRAVIPESCFDKNFDTFVLRGLFDTDGCVALTNNNGILYPRLELKICPSPMKSQVISIFKKYGFNFKVQQLDKKKIRIRVNGKKELKKWIHTIGFSNKKHLEKSKIFLR